MGSPYQQQSHQKHERLRIAKIIRHGCLQTKPLRDYQPPQERTQPLHQHLLRQHRRHRIHHHLRTHPKPTIDLFLIYLRPFLTISQVNEQKTKQLREETL